MEDYPDSVIKQVNKIKEDILKLVTKINAGKDARIECGELSRTLDGQWPIIEKFIFKEPTSVEQQWQRNIIETKLLKHLNGIDI